MEVKVKKTYKEKLLDPRWQKKRLEILSRDGFACYWCGDTTSTLHVHHEKYHKDPWDAPDEDLVTVCEDCHSVNHAGLTELEAVLVNYLRYIDKGCSHNIKLLNKTVRKHK